MSSGLMALNHQLYTFTTAFSYKISKSVTFFTSERLSTEIKGCMNTEVVLLKLQIVMLAFVCGVLSMNQQRGHRSLQVPSNEACSCHLEQTVGRKKYGKVEKFVGLDLQIECYHPDQITRMVMQTRTGPKYNSSAYTHPQTH